MLKEFYYITIDGYFLCLFVYSTKWLERHTHATLLLSQGKRGASVKVVAERLENTPQMILDIYGHTFLDLKEETVQLFSESLSGAKTGATSE